MAVAAPRRRADGNEHRIGGFHRGSDLLGEFQASGFRVGGNQIVEAGLVDQHLAAAERGDFGRVLVDAGHLVAEIGETGPGNEPDITGADHGNAHSISP